MLKTDGKYYLDLMKNLLLEFYEKMLTNKNNRKEI